MARKPARQPDFRVPGLAGDLADDEPAEVPPDEPRPILPEELPLATAQAAPPAEPLKPAAPAEPAELVLSIDVPLDMQPLPREFTIHIDTRLSVEQSTAARRLALALDRRGARLANGQRITSAVQAVRYLLEAIAP